MKQLTRGFQISFAIHTLVFGIILIAGSSSMMRGSVMVIDFTLEPPSNGTASPGAKAKVPTLNRHMPAKEEAQTSEAKPLIAKKEPPAVEETEKPLTPPPHEKPKPELASPLSGAQVPVFGPITPDIRSAESAPASSITLRQGGAADVVRGDSSPGLQAGHTGGENTAGQPGIGYVKRNFAYIRDIIMKHLAYPVIARKMGWSGTLVVSFIIREDGNVEDVRILKSSGFDVLDKRAVETIKEVCPFPRPPVKAELRMPIVYRLE